MATELHGCGWRPERIHRRVAGRIGTVARIGALLQPERGGSTREPWIQEQWAKEACTGATGSEFIYELIGAKTSMWMIWAYGRLRDGARPETLSNTGVRSSSMLTALRKHGACSWQDWHPGVPGFDYNGLPFGLMRTGAQKYNVDAVQLYASGSSLVARIVDALARGYVCGVVVRVDRLFDAAKSDPVPPEDGSPVRGRHIICARSFYRSGGSYVIECVNSWGVDHGDSGIVRLSAERVGQSPFCSIARSVS